MDKEVTEFLEFFETLSDSERKFTMLYNLNDGISGEEYWEMDDLWDGESPDELTDEEFERSKKAFDMFFHLSDENQRFSGFKRHQCWACKGYLFPGSGAGGILISYLNHTDDCSGNPFDYGTKRIGEVIRSETAITCASCHYNLVDESGGISFRHMGLG